MHKSIGYTVFSCSNKNSEHELHEFIECFLSQQITQIAQLPSGWNCSPKVGELPVRVRGMSKRKAKLGKSNILSTPPP